MPLGSFAVTDTGSLAWVHGVKKAEYLYILKVNVEKWLPVWPSVFPTSQ